MKDIPFSSRGTDRKVLTVLYSLAGPAIVAYLFPIPLYFPGSRFLNALVTVAILGIVWGVFYLFRPTRRVAQGWIIAIKIAVPVVWLILVIALRMWLSHVRTGIDDLLSLPF